MARSRGFVQTRAARRQKSWETGPGQGAVTTSSVSANQILGAGAQAQEDGLTLLRLRGRYSAFLTAVSAINDGYHGAFGIGIVTAEAFSIGVTAVPLPITDVGWDGWIFWSPVQLQAHVATAAGETEVSQEMEVDTKAMRKLRLGDTIYAVTELIEVGTAVISQAFDSRLLVALP